MVAPLSTDTYSTLRVLLRKTSPPGPSSLLFLTPGLFWSEGRWSADDIHLLPPLDVACGSNSVKDRLTEVLPARPSVRLNPTNNAETGMGINHLKVR